MNDCDALLQDVIRQAKALGIPISEHISPHVEINGRAVNRFGCCRRKGEDCTIEVALRVAKGPEESCRVVLAHEVLHTCVGCHNHGARWKKYAEKMRLAYGYEIRRTSSNEALGLEEPREGKYLLRCTSCGAEIRRFRASPLTRFPERYRCRCGGRIERVM